MSYTPKLGWIHPDDRTEAQHAAHARAMAKAVRFGIEGFIEPTVPVKVMLSDFWKHSDVVADIGEEFTGFHQLTGSCVGASEGNGVFTLGAVQRAIGDNPTRAFVPWWLFPYGRTRFAEGDRGQGEGAVDSVMGEILSTEGLFDHLQPGLPQFKKDDGWYLTEDIEMEWSDGGTPEIMKWLEIAKPHTLTQAPIDDVSQIRAGIINGYPTLYGCSMYINSAKIVGSGANAYARGVYDRSGGHSTLYIAYWDHPNDGPLYGMSNQWPTSVYLKDPAGLGRCMCWTPESEVVKVLTRYGGGNGESMALSHLKWFPAQPKVMDWFI